MTRLNEYSHIETQIHPNDEMYSFFTTHPQHKDEPLASYFDSGAGMITSLLGIMKNIGIKIEETNSFLEFACGYGRFTRHLVKIIAAENITGSDVYKEAVDFQKKVFGVKGFYSNFNPDRVVIPQKYDIIFVASLFSHLPEKTWRPWLKKLYYSLNEHGVLIFSTHGPTCLAVSAEIPATGLLYLNMSESKIHSFKDYATTYVTSSFVHQAVREETGESILLEVPKCLWGYQDVYVVRKILKDGPEPESNQVTSFNMTQKLAGLFRNIFNKAITSRIYTSNGVNSDIQGSGFKVQGSRFPTCTNNVNP